MAKVKNQSKDIQDASIAQAEAAADQFDENGPGVQEIGDFIVVDPATPEGEAKAAELDATAPLVNIPSTAETNPNHVQKGVTSEPISGTVTVDFGNGNVLTGCLVLNSSFGPNGEEKNVLVPFADQPGTFYSLGHVPAACVK